MSFGLSTSLPTSTSQSLNLKDSCFSNNNNNNNNTKSVAMLVKEKEDEQEEEEVEGNTNKSLKRHEKKVYMLKRESAKNFEEKLLNKMTDLEEANAKNEKLLLVAANSNSKIPKIEKPAVDASDFSTTFEAVNGDVESNAKKNMLIEIKREQQTNSHLSLNRLNVNNRHATKNSKSKSEMELINSIESSEASLNSSNMSSTETSFIQVNEKLVHRGLQTSGLGMGTMGDENIQSFDSSRRSSNDLNMRSHNELPPRPPIKKIK
jgi:hypothetical protein